MGQFVVSILGHSQAFPLGVSGTGVIKELGQIQGGWLAFAAVLGQRSLIGQHLLLQFQTPLRQPGYPFVGKSELLFQIGNAALRRRKSLGDLFVHNRILLFFMMRLQPQQPGRSMFGGIVHRWGVAACREQFDDQGTPCLQQQADQPDGTHGDGILHPHAQ